MIDVKKAVTFNFDLQRHTIQGLVPGRLAQVEVSLDGQAWKKVGRLVEATLNSSRAEDEATTHDSGEDDEFYPGRRNSTISGEWRYDEADEGQEILADAHFAAMDAEGDVDDITFHVRFKLKSSGRVFVCDEAFLTQFEIRGPNQGLCPLNMTIRLNRIEKEEGS